MLTVVPKLHRKQCTVDILYYSAVRSTFQDLQPQVKLKLLLSFFHIPRRNLEIWRSKLEAILDAASDDSEPWVCMLAELIRTYPSSGQLNPDIRAPDTNRKLFNDLVQDVKRALKRSDQSEAVLPLECHYLNKNAFITAVGHMPQTAKHFTLKRKPKAAALKAELINKSQDAASKVRSSSGGAFPMRKSTMPRKMTSDVKIGARSSFGGQQAGFRNHSRPGMPNRPTARKPGEGGGVKLLDINEQPMGYAQAKKRKKQLEEEERERAEKEKKERKEQEKREKMESKANKEAAASAAGINANNNSGGGAMPGLGDKDQTPDYAAGLTSMNPATPSSSLPPPSYAPPTPTPIHTPQVAPPPPQPTVTHIQQQQQPPNIIPAAAVSSLSAPSYAPPRPAAVSSGVTLAPPTAVSIVRPPPAGVSLPTAPVPPTPPPNTPFPAGLSSLEPLPQAAVRNLPVSVSLPRNPAGAPQTVAGGGAPRIVQLPTQPLPQSQVLALVCYYRFFVSNLRFT